MFQVRANEYMSGNILRKIGKKLSRNSLILTLTKKKFVHDYNNSSNVKIFETNPTKVEMNINYDSKQNVPVSFRGYRFITKNCYIDPNHGAHVTNDFKLIVENSGCHNVDIALQSLFATAFYRAFRFRKIKIKSIDFGVSFAGEWTNNYFHYVSDWMTRFSYIYADHSILKQKVIVVTPASANHFQVEYLRNLMPSAWELYVPIGSEIIHVHNLVVYSVPKKRNVSLPSIYEYDNTVYNPAFYEIIPDKFGNIATTTSSKILILLIKRSFKNGRNIENLDELRCKIESAFPDQIIITAELENLPLELQIGLFKRADVVVGAYGAGLTNIVYCNSAHIIEVTQKPARIHYNPLAYYFNNKYSMITTPTTSTNPICLTGRNVTDILNIVKSSVSDS